MLLIFFYSLRNLKENCFFCAQNRAQNAKQANLLKLVEKAPVTPKPASKPVTPQPSKPVTPKRLLSPSQVTPKCSQNGNWLPNLCHKFIFS